MVTEAKRFRASVDVVFGRDIPDAPDPDWPHFAPYVKVLRRLGDVDYDVDADTTGKFRWIKKIGQSIGQIEPAFEFVMKDPYWHRAWKTWRDQVPEDLRMIIPFPEKPDPRPSKQPATEETSSKGKGKGKAAAEKTTGGGSGTKRARTSGAAASTRTKKPKIVKDLTEDERTMFNSYLLTQKGPLKAFVNSTFQGIPEASRQSLQEAIMKVDDFSSCL